MMMPIILGVVFLLTLSGGMAFSVYYFVKKTDPKNIDKSLKNDIDTAQDFLPFNDIKDSVIDLGGHNYRAIIECSSINYHLKTDREKEIIELSFQRFLNSLNSPIAFYMQTKTMDNTKMLKELRSDLEITIDKFPQLAEYANNYYGEVSELHTTIGNNKTKKKFIIVPYSEAINLNHLSDEEKYEYSLKELYSKCQILIDGLKSMGINSIMLNTKGIVELLVSTYHKDNYAQIDGIVNGEYFELILKGEKNKLAEITSDAKLDWILYDAQLRLETELINEETESDVRKSADKAIEEIGKIRETLAGYYQSKEIGGVSSIISIDK